MIGMTVTYKVRGNAEVSRRMKEKVKDIMRGAREGMVGAAMIIESESKGLAPVDTANLRASHFIYAQGLQVPQPRIFAIAGVDVAQLTSAFMHTIAEAQSQVNHDMMVRVGAAAFYAQVVEFGNPSRNWNRGGPRYMRTARDRNVLNILKLAARGAARGLR